MMHARAFGVATRACCGVGLGRQEKFAHISDVYLLCIRMFVCVCARANH